MTKQPKRSFWQVFLANLAFISLFAAPLKYLFFRNWDLPDGVVLALWIVSACAVGGLIYWIYRAGRDPFPYSYPGPTGFWRIWFDRLPARIGPSFSAAAHIELVVIADSEHVGIATEIRDGHDPHSLHVVVLRIDERPLSELLAHLQVVLAEATAILVAWTPEMRRHMEIIEALDDWATQNTHKPILFINYIEDQMYNLVFPSVSKEHWQKAVWLLFARAVDRANLWRRQASLYQRIWFATCIVTLFLGATGLLETKRILDDSKKLRAHLQSYSDVAYRLEVLRETCGQLTAALAPEAKEQLRADVFGALAQFATHTHRQIESAYGRISEEQAHVSFWRRMTWADTTGVPRRLVVQVAWSGGRRATVFSDDYNSIIGSAFRERAFVMWRGAPRPGRVGSWDLQGDPRGIWNKDGEIEFLRPYDGWRPTGHYGPLLLDRARAGLFAFAASTSDTSVESGILIDTPDNPEVLRDKWVGDLMAQAVFVIQAVPDSALLSREVIAALNRRGFGLAPSKLPKKR